MAIIVIFVLIKVQLKRFQVQSVRCNMTNLENFKAQFTPEKPTRVVVLGSSDVVYMPKMVAQSFLFNRNILYPVIRTSQDKSILVIFFDKPKEYYEKCYKIYRIKRKNGYATFIPVPKSLRPVLASSSKRPLITYSLGLLDKQMVIVMEKF